MKLNQPIRFFVISSIFSSLTMATSGCGSSPAPAPKPAATPAPATTSATSAAAIVSYCQPRGGTVVGSGSNTLCKLTLPASTGTSLIYAGGIPGTPSALPQLTPANPNPLTDLQLNFQLQPGDRLSVAATATWGAIQISTSSALGGFFNFTTVTTNCSLANADGLQINGTALPQNGGLNQGLVASDQKQVYFLGGTGSAIIKNAGNLSVGINYAGSATQGCGSLQISSIQVERCVDATGATRTCP